MNELFPIGAGLLLGIAYSLQSRRISRVWQALLVVVIGLAATLLSGEYAENWGFVIVDIGETALAFWVALAGLGYLRIGALNSTAASRIRIR
ncbi:MAG TPA: hypothetical protein VLI93_04455 [Acetobacteraceae bacterium]|nr:hypothetical protein [Acetobacteraceae bacterium]